MSDVCVFNTFRQVIFTEILGTSLPYTHMSKNYRPSAHALFLQHLCPRVAPTLVRPPAARRGQVLRNERGTPPHACLLCRGQGR